MTAIRTARERARAELTREIKEEARRRLAADGAEQLSLRAVARELGMASSALYRYFASRDDLLTALITDAYNALGSRVEGADAEARDSGAGPRARWRRVCHAARAWARAHPHEYALLYGTPVTGYQAPQDTVQPASRVPMTLLRVAASAGTRTVPAATPLPTQLAEQARLVAGMAPQAQVPDTTALDPQVLVRAMMAWTQLFGALSFELFGHLKGSADPADGFFTYCVETTADLLALPTDPAERVPEAAEFPNGSAAEALPKAATAGATDTVTPDGTTRE